MDFDLYSSQKRAHRPNLTLFANAKHSPFLKKRNKKDGVSPQEVRNRSGMGPNQPVEKKRGSPFTVSDHPDSILMSHFVR